MAPRPPSAVHRQPPDAHLDSLPADDGSPGRVIASMVGIVAILLLGSLFWSALGALVSAVGDMAGSFPNSRPTPTHFLEGSQPAPTPISLAPTATPVLAAAPRSAEPTPLPVDSPTVEPTPLPTTEPTPAPTSESTPTPAGERAPWVLLPQPAPGTRVAAGAVVVEARGRGDAPIAEIQLELDGAAVPVALEQRSESIWRGAASVEIAAGHHVARATVVDAKGRTGSFRWSFDAGS